MIKEIRMCEKDIRYSDVKRLRATSTCPEDLLSRWGTRDQMHTRKLEPLFPRHRHPTTEKQSDNSGRQPREHILMCIETTLPFFFLCWEPERAKSASCLDPMRQPRCQWCTTWRPRPKPNQNKILKSRSRGTQWSVETVLGLWQWTKYRCIRKSWFLGDSKSDNVWYLLCQSTNNAICWPLIKKDSLISAHPKFRHVSATGIPSNKCITNEWL